MRPLSRSGRICFLSGLIALAALGCSQNLENNEQFQAQVSRLERMDEDLKNAMKTITGLENEFQQVLKEVGDLKNVAAGGTAGGGASADALKSLEQRLNGLEAELKKSASGRVASAPAEPRTEARTQSAAEAPEDAADAAAETPAETRSGGAKTRVQPSLKPARRSVASVAVVGRTTKAPAAPKTATSKASRTAAAAASTSKRSASTASSGFYHEIGASDTVSSLAAKYGVSTDAILKANQLPSNFRLRIGQSLYIPRSGGR